MRTSLMVAMVLVMGTGCASFKDGVSQNMRQSITRGGGDMSATAVLDAGVNKPELIAFTQGLVKLIEQGTLTKGVFQAKAQELAGGKYADYIAQLFAIIPSDLGVDQLIPPEIKKYLLSFLRDGALYGMGLYDESLRPVPSTPAAKPAATPAKPVEVPKPAAPAATPAPAPAK